MPCAAILLTGGSSRRMGTDKASLRMGPSDPTLAERTGALLAAHASTAMEVGPGSSGLPSVSEEPRGGGPLVAIASGWEVLRRSEWDGPAIVVATDLPFLDGEVISWLASHRSSRSVVPSISGRVQPLCARYAPADLDTAVALVASGRRSMKDLLAAIPALVVTEGELPGPAGSLTDIDTPADLETARQRLRK